MVTQMLFYCIATSFEESEFGIFLRGALTACTVQYNYLQRRVLYSFPEVKKRFYTYVGVITIILLRLLYSNIIGTIPNII